MTEGLPKQVSPWMRGLLLMAGFYNLIWGFFIFNFPDQFYSWLQEKEREGGKLVEYQGVGVLIFALLYLLCSLYPVRFWFLILVGLLSKVLGAVGVYFFVLNKLVTDHFIFHLIVNDLAWALPLVIIAYRAFWLRNIHNYEKAS